MTSYSVAPFNLSPWKTVLKWCCVRSLSLPHRQFIRSKNKVKQVERYFGILMSFLSLLWPKPYELPWILGLKLGTLLGYTFTRIKIQATRCKKHIYMLVTLVDRWRTGLEKHRSDIKSSPDNCEFAVQKHQKFYRFKNRSQSP